jgi:hypothetical protein
MDNMKIIEVLNYKPLLKECFESDPILLEKFHIYAGQGLDACVNKTYQDLQEMNVTLFKIEKNSELVGYFAKELFDSKEYLTGFFIVPKFRTKEFKNEFWNLIKKEFKPSFFCGLFEKNIPANKFIKSNGGKIVKQCMISDGSAILYEIGA